MADTKGNKSRPNRFQISQAFVKVLRADTDLATQMVKHKKCFFDCDTPQRQKTMVRGIIERVIKACGPEFNDWQLNPTTSECQKALYDLDAHFLFRFTGDETRDSTKRNYRADCMKRYMVCGAVLQHHWTQITRLAS